MSGFYLCDPHHPNTVIKKVRKMDSLFLWEVGPLRVWIIWIVVFVAQIAIAEINRRWNWTIFALWTVGGVLMMPYAAIVGEPVFGWFPFGKYVLMVLTDRKSVV